MNSQAMSVRITSTKSIHAYLYLSVTTTADPAVRGAGGRSQGKTGTPVGARPWGNELVAAEHHLGRQVLLSLHCRLKKGKGKIKLYLRDKAFTHKPRLFLSVCAKTYRLYNKSADHVFGENGEKIKFPTTQK